MSPLLTIPETARRLRLSTSTTYRLVESGQITHVRAGSRVLIPEAAVDAYVAAHTVTALPRLRRNRSG